VGTAASAAVRLVALAGAGPAANFTLQTCCWRLLALRGGMMLHLFHSYRPPRSYLLGITLRVVFFSGIYCWARLIISFRFRSGWQYLLNAVHERNQAQNTWNGIRGTVLRWQVCCGHAGFREVFPYIVHSRCGLLLLIRTCRLAGIP